MSLAASFWGIGGAGGKENGPGGDARAVPRFVSLASGKDVHIHAAGSRTVLVDADAKDKWPVLDQRWALRTVKEPLATRGQV